MTPFAKFVLLLATLLPMIVRADELPNSAFKELVNIRAMHLNNASKDNIDSYYFLYGLGLNGDDIVGTGRAYFESESNHNPNLSYEQLIQKRHDLGFYKIELSQPSSGVNIFCRPEQDNCIKKLFDHSSMWQSIIQKNEQPLARYQEFLRREPAINVNLLTPHTPMPDYSFLMKLQRLTHLSYLNTANKTAVAHALQKEQEALKNQLRLADTLIQKLVMQRLLRDNLQMTVLLKTRFGINMNTVISHLTVDEKSLKLPIAYEFLSAEQSLQSIMANQKHYHHYNTHNAIANHAIGQIEFSQNSALNIGKHILNKPQEQTQYPIHIDRRTNELGFVLANMAVIDYETYAQRLNELDNVINMTNYVLSNDKTHLINVFTNDSQGIVTDDDKICMPLPKPDSQRVQTCVYL